MKRKDFIKKGLLSAAGVAGVGSLSSCQGDTGTATAPSVNINTNETFKWRMTTVWGKNFPVFGEAANLLSEWVDTMSRGRFKIKIFGSGELVPGLEAFDTTSAGTTEMGSGADHFCWND